MSHPSREETEPREFRWIVDGHNMIFAIDELERLQLQKQKREARLQLEDSLERFGRAIGAQVWVVYDGNAMDRNPDACDRPFLRTLYSNPPEEADDRIRLLARQCLGRGEHPAVVSSDRRTLLHDLPQGVRGLTIDRFVRGVFRRTLGSPEKWNPEGMNDVEDYFLRHSPFAEDRDLAPDSDEGERPDPSATGHDP